MLLAPQLKVHENPQRKPPPTQLRTDPMRPDPATTPGPGSPNCTVSEAWMLRWPPPWRNGQKSHPKNRIHVVHATVGGV